MTAINPIGRNNLQFRRQTTRYNKPKGSFSSNQGYLSVARDARTGRFVSRVKIKPTFMSHIMEIINA